MSWIIQFLIFIDLFLLQFSMHILKTNTILSQKKKTYKHKKHFIFILGKVFINILLLPLLVIILLLLCDFYLFIYVKYAMHIFKIN